MVMTVQDGSSIGTLNDFSVGATARSPAPTATA
jgi:hypothetical protein